MKSSDRLLRLWALVGATRFYGRLVIAFAFGALFMGPFVDSPAYPWIRSVVANLPLLEKLLDVEGILVDALVGAFALLFLSWSSFLYVYSAMRDVDAKSMDYWALIPGYFSGAPGALIAGWGATLTGFGHYALLSYGRESVGPALMVYGLLVLAIGMWLRAIARPSIVGREWLHRNARRFAVIPGVLSIAACLFVTFSDPLRLLLITKELYRSLV